jgi:hypothetical protein
MDASSSENPSKLGFKMTLLFMLWLSITDTFKRLLFPEHGFKSKIVTHHYNFKTIGQLR